MANFFEKSEYACQCGCGFDGIDPLLLAKLNFMREKMGEPIHITSGCRCPQHNKVVGGEENSSHMRGLAVDIDCKKSGVFMWNILNAAIEAGFLRIGISSKCSFVHLDVDKKKTQQIVWFYDR